ncbi:alpha/beta-hydrolase [Sarocladium strictum]
MHPNRAAVEEDRVPALPKTAEPFLDRIGCFFRLWLTKIAATLLFKYLRFSQPLPPSTKPTLVKYYSSRPKLQARIYYPDNYESGKLLPLFFNVHSGGFALLDPESDDEWCSMWAKRMGMLVVSLDYSKAPLNPFPVPVYDVAALAKDVLDDINLPIDKTRVAIGGFSSGANLALTAAQLPELKGTVKAALSFMPPVDFGHDPAEKLRRRPYKTGPKESLEASSWAFDWGYVPAGQNRHDPLLSPYWAKREDLPPWICIVGAEWDMLRFEAQVMMCELADLEAVQEESFEEGRYKWVLARRCSHMFTHHWGKSGERKRIREERAEPIYEETARWLAKALES